MNALKLPFLTALFVLLAGCSFFTGTARVFDLADSVTQHAKASLLLHNAIGTQVAAFVESPEVTGQRKEQARQVYRRTVCSSEVEVSTRIEDCRDGPSYKADRAVLAYEAVQSARNEDELTAAIDDLVPLLLEITTIINGD